MALTVLSTLPADGASNVSPNGYIQAVFSKNLDPLSVNEGTVLITNLNTNETSTAEITLKLNSIRILPAIVLDEYTSHRVDLIGQSAGSPSGYVKAADTDPLAITYSFTFQTGQAAIPKVITTIGTDETISIGPDLDQSGVSDSLQKVETASGEITEAYEDDLYILDSDPLNGDSNVDSAWVNDTGITIRFSRPIDSDTVARSVKIKQAAIAGYIFAGSNEYDIRDRVTNSGDYYCIDNQRAYYNPQTTLTVSNEYLFIMFPQKPIRLNSEIDITILQTLESTAGTSGNKVFLKQKEELFFTTFFFPNWLDIEQIRLGLSHVGVIATDEVITRLSVIQSISAWRTACRHFDMCNPPMYAIDLAYSKTCLAIYDMSQARNVAQLGHTKSLGDFSITYTGKSRFRTPAETDLADKIKDLTRKLKDIYCNPVYTQYANRGIENATMQPDFRMRTWKFSNLIPMRENDMFYRSARLPKYTDLWS